ncbi:hypothetical protein [Roseofilum casamattae]|uniref:Uncharacterized protein n=1 Tax=Roseofilum casamattae BLCC-M143 TaxID=3022442 RepID=A0ABT7BTZ5_9CYAN|nr:hypothetical protein [Roseofilum casamattae]MDJ1181763.1 hypothetical protein [Roseofilum casamattae BLCC-M143]
MILIRDIVQQALTSGYLTQTREDQLRYLLQRTQYGLEDVQAFVRLQQATLSGKVLQESRGSERGV